MVQCPGEKETRDWQGKGGCSAQVGDGRRQDMEVAGTGRTVGLTLKVLGNHGKYVPRGGIWLDSGVHRLPLAAIRGTDCRGLWLTLVGQEGVNCFGLGGR